MTTQELEQRLTKLENEVSTLCAEVLGTKPGWRQAIDEFAGDEGLQEIVAGAMKLRDADRKKAKARKNTTRKPKK
jgi:hypothetical protein